MLVCPWSPPANASNNSKNSSTPTSDLLLPSKLEPTYQSDGETVWRKRGRTPRVGWDRKWLDTVQIGRINPKWIDTKSTATEETTKALEKEIDSSPSPLYLRYLGPGSSSQASGCRSWDIYHILFFTGKHRPYISDFTVPIVFTYSQPLRKFHGIIDSRLFRMASGFRTCYSLDKTWKSCNAFSLWHTDG